MSLVGAKNNNLKNVFKIYCTISSSSYLAPKISYNITIKYEPAIIFEIFSVLQVLAINIIHSKIISSSYSSLPRIDSRN